MVDLLLCGLQFQNLTFSLGSSFASRHKRIYYCLCTPCIKHQHIVIDLRILVNLNWAARSLNIWVRPSQSVLPKVGGFCALKSCQASLKKKLSLFLEHLLQVLKLCLFLNAAIWASMHSNLVLPLYQVTHSVPALLLSACREHFCKQAAPSSLHSFKAVSSSCSIRNHLFHALMHHPSYKERKESNSSAWQFQNARNKGTLLELKHTAKAKWPLVTHQVFCSR